ncbi:MAG: hypothetical protein KAJ55_09975, partial [Anaerolineales bacterium]|nr:hypothetical protein [Anaerolineales bacterium]
GVDWRRRTLEFAGKVKEEFFWCSRMHADQWILSLNGNILLKNEILRRCVPLMTLSGNRSC